MAATEVLNAERGRSPIDPPRSGEPHRKGGHGWVWFVVIALIVVGAIWYSTHSRSKAAAAGPQGRGQGRFQAGDVSVGVVSVGKQDVPFYLTGLGSVTAFNTVTVHSRVDGQMMKVYFQEGQFVHAGDELADIDPRPFQVALDQAQGQLAKDMAAQSDAKNNLNRYQQLFQEGVIPRQQLDSQQSMVGQFDGSIQGDKAQIDNEKLQLTYAHIVSPIDGRVGLRLVDPGNIVHAADSSGILVITQVRPIAVVFTLPEDELPQVVSEMKNRTLEVEAYSRDDNSKLAQGKLLTLDNQIDPTTGTIKLKSQFDNADLSLWPNQFVNIRLFLSVKKDAIVIPTAAIQNGAQGSFVYVVNSDKAAMVQPIQVDFNQGNISVIRTGLQAGQQIVIDGQDKIQAGAKVVPHASSLNLFDNTGGANPSGAGSGAAAQPGVAPDDASGTKRIHRRDGTQGSGFQHSGQGQGSPQ
jgi:multidrug efflux system membrane fusion protein